jgi:hypothetical protein
MYCKEDDDNHVCLMMKREDLGNVPSVFLKKDEKSKDYVTKIW